MGGDFGQDGTFQAIVSRGGFDKEGSARLRSEQMKELLRSIQVVEKSATENDIEDPIPLEVPNVVIDKRQIRKSKPLLHEAAFIKVCFPHLDAHHFAEAQPSQLDGVATFKTAQVCTAKPFVASGVKYAETSFRAQDPRVVGYGDAAWLGFRTIGKNNVMGSKMHMVRATV